MENKTKSKFNKLCNIILESIGDQYGLSDFKFPKYKFGKVNVGDTYIYVYTSSVGESGNWNIPYWTISAKVVKVIEVKDNGFKLDNGLIVNKNNNVQIETQTETRSGYSDAIDSYDFGEHTKGAEQTYKVTRKYGKGVYPASFLLKYYDEHIKGYSLIGGGGSYKGPNKEELMNIAKQETDIVNTINKKAKNNLSDDQITPDEKDIQRIYDLFKNNIPSNQIGLFWNPNKNSIIQKWITSIDEYIATNDTNGSWWRNYLRPLNQLDNIKSIDFDAEINFDTKTLEKQAEKMTKLIKDYDKALRRLKAIPIVKQKLLNQLKTICEQKPWYELKIGKTFLNDLEKIKNIPGFKRIQKRIESLKNDVQLNYNIDPSINKTFENIEKIFQNKVDELKQYLN